MINFGQPTDLGIVLNALKSALTVGSPPIVDLTRLFISLETVDRLEKDPLDDSWLSIAPTSFNVNQGVVMGGGTSTTEQDGNLEITQWNRYEADYTHDDVLAITDTSLGIIAAWKPIMKALQMLTPLDPVTGWCYLIEPMRLVSWKFVKRSPNNPWLRIISNWECKYVENLEQGTL